MSDFVAANDNVPAPANDNVAQAPPAAETTAAVEAPGAVDPAVEVPRDSAVAPAAETPPAADSVTNVAAPGAADPLAGLEVAAQHPGGLSDAFNSAASDTLGTTVDDAGSDEVDADDEVMDDDPALDDEEVMDDDDDVSDADGGRDVPADPPRQGPEAPARIFDRDHPGISPAFNRVARPPGKPAEADDPSDLGKRLDPPGPHPYPTGPKPPTP